MSDSLEIQPVTKPIRGAIRPPGSKSLTNRALIVAALAEGTSRLSGLLDSRDTQVMANGLRQMGIELQFDPTCGTAVVRGCAGSPPASSAAIRIENSGTSIRFLTAFCTLATGEFHLDGNERMRQRPIVDLVDALNTLGADVCCNEQSPGPPVTVRGNGLSGGTAKIAGTTSSQYLSALLMAAPCARSPVELQVEGDLVSQPYVAMTIGVMREFDVTIDVVSPECFRIAKQTYRSCDFAVEPDASAASYFFAAAAITGGEVTVLGLSRRSLQGDVRFIDVLEQMGCTVFWGDDRVTVSGGELQGIEVDMNDISDTAQTLAAVAVFANGPTRITNIAHVRHKETDRIAAVAAELQKLGITVDEFNDGLTVHPGQPQPGVVKTYDDHRMAMSFALIGLRTPGIQIADPGCTEKTYPRFFEDLKELRGGVSA